MTRTPDKARLAAAGPIRVREHQLALEREEMREMPEEEVGELALIYRAKGLDAAQGEGPGRRIVSDPERGSTRWPARSWASASEVSPRRPGRRRLVPELRRRGISALLPHLLARGRVALVGTIVPAGAGLPGVGAFMSLFTGRGVFWSALHMALLGAAAAGLSYAVGRLLGVSIG